MFKKSILPFLFLICFASINSQIANFKEKFTLPNNVNETSGLLFFDGKIITHNDSGGEPNLYEIDSLTGNLLRTIAINNASNVYWEAITEEKPTYILAILETIVEIDKIYAFIKF